MLGYIMNLSEIVKAAYKDSGTALIFSSLVFLSHRFYSALKRCNNLTEYSIRMEKGKFTSLSIKTIYVNTFPVLCS